jgi:hypothetical protein
MPQLRTTLSERREVARAKRFCKKAIRLFESMNPDQQAAFRRRCAGKARYQESVELSRELAASAVREILIKLEFPANIVLAVTAETVEDYLSQWIEGDLIIDDGRIQQKLRKILDDLREEVGEIEDRQLNSKTLTYRELFKTPLYALLPLSFTGHFDLGTEIRILHIGAYAQWLNVKDVEDSGDEDDKCWKRGALDAIVIALTRGYYSIAQIAEATGIDEKAISGFWESYKVSVDLTEPLTFEDCLWNILPMKLALEVDCKGSVGRPPIRELHPASRL